MSVDVPHVRYALLTAIADEEEKFNDCEAPQAQNVDVNVVAVEVRYDKVGTTPAVTRNRPRHDRRNLIIPRSVTVFEQDMLFLISTFSGTYSTEAGRYFVEHLSRVTDTADCATLNLSLAGSTTVGPSLAGCTTVDPSLAGCTTVDPSLARCTTVNPSLAGCTAVDPSLAGCSAVGPSLAGCTTVDPSLAGCTAVDPSLAVRTTVHSSLAGCTTVGPMGGSLAASSSIIMWPTHETDVMEIVNGDFCSDVNWIFAYYYKDQLGIVGCPISATIIGSLYPLSPSPNYSKLYSTVFFEKPDKYMRPMGEILVAAIAAYDKWKEYETNKENRLWILQMIIFFGTVISFLYAIKWYFS
jgi:hypothetical protein